MLNGQGTSWEEPPPESEGRWGLPMCEASATGEGAAGGVIWLCGLLGAYALFVLLAYFNLADGDMWARLAVGASVWLRGGLLRSDLFAFTPTLERWVDHEWGTGVILYALLSWLGPVSLMVLKMVCAAAGLLAAAACARQQRASREVILLVILFAGAAVVSGFVHVVRSQVFSYALFGVTLHLLERLRERPGRWPVVVLVVTQMAWANLHGGFVVGLGTIGVYGVVSWARGERWRVFALVLVLAGLGTLVNPYGWEYWIYMIRAVRHPRAAIPEWGPMALVGLDLYTPFRVLVLLGLLLVGVRSRAGWRQVVTPGTLVMVICAVASFLHRRHAPFFALAAMAALPVLAEDMVQRWRTGGVRRERVLQGVLILLYAGVAALVAFRWLPGATLQVLAPAGFYPVREADILAQAGVTGKLAVPFRWGSYASWRLYPRTKVSIDGRYEEVYPDSTFDLNHRFFFHEGEQWAELVERFEVDFVILDDTLQERMVRDLAERGYDVVWRTPRSALLCKRAWTPTLRGVAAALPPYTINPLDADIPKAWWPAPASAQSGD